MDAISYLDKAGMNLSYQIVAEARKTPLKEAQKIQVAVVVLEHGSERRVVTALMEYGDGDGTAMAEAYCACTAADSERIYVKVLDLDLSAELEE